jgi:hypothetical protein
MPKERRKRADGTEIDPVADLADFVQSFGASEEPAAAVADETPPEKTPVQIAAPEDEYAGKSPEEVIAAARAARITVREKEQELLEAKNERDRLRMEAAARKAVSEQQPRNTETPQPAPVDPRETAIQEKWYTDPAEARRLMREIDDERHQQQLATARTEIKTELTVEQQQQQRKERGDRAFAESRRKLIELGVPEADLNNYDKIGAVYQTITRRPTDALPNPYYVAGGPLEEDVIVQAWKNLFGVPSGNGSTTQAPPPPEQQRSAPQIVAPPGSSRPAAAAVPARQRATPVPADMQRDLSHLAEQLGHDPAKLIARRRARMERDNQ